MPEIVYMQLCTVASGGECLERLPMIEFLSAMCGEARNELLLDYEASMGKVFSTFAAHMLDGFKHVECEACFIQQTDRVRLRRGNCTIHKQSGESVLQC